MPKLARVQVAVRKLVLSMGEELLVTRTDGTTQTLVASPQPYDLLITHDQRPEGYFNLANPAPTDFVFLGEADVRENVDVITYDGDKFKIARVVPEPMTGTPIVKHALSNRVDATYG